MRRGDSNDFDLSLRRRRLRFVAQYDDTECGLACLVMIAGYHHGRAPSMDQLRRLAGPAAHGVTLQDLLGIAQTLGLEGRAYKLELDGLRTFAKGTLLHWNFNHYVVLVAASRSGVRILDPAGGERIVGWREASDAFTGVAVVFSRGGHLALEPVREKAALPAYVRAALEHFWLVATVTVAAFVLQLIGLGPAIALAFAVERVLPGAHVYEGLIVAGALVVAGAAVYWTSLVRQLALATLSARTHMNKAVAFMSHLSRLPYEETQRWSTGDLVNRINSLGTLRQLVSVGLMAGILDGVLASIYLAALFFVDARFGVYVSCVALVGIAILIWGNRAHRRLSATEQQCESDLQSRQLELVAGLRALKAMGRERAQLQTWSAQLSERLNAHIEKDRLQAQVTSLQRGMELAVSGGMIGFAVISASGGDASIGRLVGLMALTGAFMAPLSSLVELAANLGEAEQLARRIDDILRRAPESHDGRHTLLGEELEVRCEELGYRYGRDTGWVLRRVSLTVSPGALIAIVGATGSGKTTLLNCLAGLVVPSEGRVMFGGHEVSRLSPSAFRPRIGFVSQEVRLFSGTLRSNVTLGVPNASDQAVQHALWVSALDEDVEAMPMGLETPVSEGGLSLSGGQRQRVALARAILGRPTLLFLDEGTSALDSATERKVQERLASLRCTRIVVAHRLTTVMGADEIVVMSEGRLVERGSHSELLRKGGEYARLSRAGDDEEEGSGSWAARTFAM